MLSRYGERIVLMKPASTLPPIGTSPRSGCGRSLIVADSRDSRRTHQIATSRSAAAPISRNGVGTNCASEAVTLEPTIAPMVAPAAMKPNSRLPCSELKMSTTIAQKIDTTNRLNTDVQMKKKRPTHTACSGVAKCSAAPNIRMVTAKKR